MSAHPFDGAMCRDHVQYIAFALGTSEMAVCFGLLYLIAHNSSQLPVHAMGFSRQEHWSGLPFPSPGDLPDPGIKSGSSEVRADSLLTELRGKPVIA